MNKFNKKLILLSFLLIFILSIGVISAADNSSHVTLDKKDDKISLKKEISNSNTSNNEVLKSTIDFSGSTFTELENQINSCQAGDIINLNKNITNDRDYGITIDKAITINGNGSTINALGNSQIFKISSNDVVLNNIRFINAVSSTDGGAAIYGDSSNVIISNSYFIDNTVTSNWGAGGAIRWTSGSNIQVTNSYFENNNALSGGAINVDESVSDFKIAGSTFINNRAINDGGAVRYYGPNGVINNSTFINCSGASGGAISIFGSNAKINKSVFKYNKATSTALGGGAIYWGGDYGILNNSYFSYNEAPAGGGAINWPAKFAQISNSNFEYNFADDVGGALMSTSNITIRNSSFSQNKASHDGGAIYFHYSSNHAEVVECRFDKNTAGQYAGAVYMDAPYVYIHDSEFSRNSAKVGGGLYYTGSNNNVVNNITCFRNSAEYGGAFYINEGYDALHLTNSTFLKNVAYKSGAGIYFMMTNTGTYDDGLSDVDALNSPANSQRHTVVNDTGYLTWSPNGWIHVTENCYFGGSVDNFIGVSASTNDTTVVIKVSVSKDVDKDTATVNITIIDEDGNKITYNYDSSDNKWTFDNVSSTDSAVFTLTLVDQKPGEYDAIGGFSDSFYSYREGKTNYTITEPAIKGNFTILQGLINEAISNGSHVLNLDSDYTYSIGLDHGQVNIYDDIVINGNGHFIDALGMCRIFDISSGNVVLNNIRFTNGNVYGKDSTSRNKTDGGAIFAYGGNVDINNCNFYNNTAESGGAFACVNMTTIDIQNSIFANNTAEEYGGAIHFSNGTITPKYIRISKSTFISNSATNGGAVGNHDLNCNIYNSIFINNSAMNGGGVEYYSDTNCSVYNCIFINNTCTSNGAGLFTHTSNSVIDNCTFYNNHGWLGGALECYDLFNITVTNCRFNHNTVGSIGGAISITSQQGLVSYCNFTNNNAKQGGAIYCGSNYNNFTNCIFINNTATDLGGAFVFGGRYTNILNSVFNNNSARLGGAIYGGARYCIIGNSNFTNNYANTAGALYLSSSSYSNITKCIFTRNTAKVDDGGAVRYSGSNNFNILDSIFTYNIAPNNGGAINGRGNEGVISGSTFMYNNASSGSAVYWDGTGSSVRNSKFLDNKAKSAYMLLNSNDLSLIITFAGKDNYVNAIYSTNDLTVNNVSYWNGSVVNTNDVPVVRSDYEPGQNIVIEIYDSANVLVSTVTGITNNNGQAIIDYSQLPCGIYSYKAYHPDNTYYTYAENSSSFKFGDFDLLQHLVNKAGDNGVVTLTRNYTYTIGIDTITEGIVVDKNNLKINGDSYTINALSKSRIFDVKGDDVILANVTCINGIANNGGAILVESSADNFNIVNTVFKDNVALDVAGAVYWNSSSGKINNSKFISNHAKTAGAILWNDANCNIAYTNFNDNYATASAGAVYCNASNSKLDHVNFTANHAANDGGAIWIARSCSVSNSNFKDNYAGGNGGAIYSNGNDVVLSNVNFSKNNVEGKGGAVYVRYDSNIISNAKFDGDYANNDGGAVYFYGDYNKIYNSTFKNTNALNGGAVYLAGAYGSIYNASFVNVSAKENGGAVHSVSYTATLNHTTFDNVYAKEFGGAIYLSGEKSQIINTQVENSYAGCGGGIYSLASRAIISKSKFKNVSAIGSQLGRGGGAIYSTGSYVNITDSNFTDCSAYRQGGAVWVWNRGGLLNNLRFVNNSVTASEADYVEGGALYIFHSMSINVTNSYFENNSAKYGGAIYAHAESGEVSSKILSNLTFVKNTASEYGGAITFQSNANGYSVINSTFIDNEANRGANAIYYSAGSSNTLNNSIYNSTFDGENHILIENNMRASLENNKEINSKNSDYFVYNKGTIALSKNSLKNLIVNYGTILTKVNVTVCDNKTYIFDGFYFPLNATAVDDNNNPVVSDLLKFTTNHADNVDSDIDDDIHTATLITNKVHYIVSISDVGLPNVNIKTAEINVIAKLGSYTWLQSIIDNLTDTTLVLTRNVTFDPDYDLSIYNIYYGKINFTNGMNYNKTFILQGNNFTISGFNQARIFTITARDIIINNTNFINGSNINAGGALNIISKNVLIANSTFKNNNAGVAGAIYSRSSGSTIENSVFRDNSAFSLAGAVMCEFSSDLTVVNNVFINNTAEIAGALYIGTVENAKIKNINFIGNKALGDCGALSYQGSGSNSVISDCNFTDNIAIGKIGAAYLTDVSVNNCNFINNTAGGDYSALYFEDTVNINLTLTNSKFINNTAGKSATVGITNPNTVVNKCNFTNNHVGGDASALYVSGYSMQGVIIANSTFDYNTAGGNGTVWFASPSGEITNCTFTHNTALNGAGIYVPVYTNSNIRNTFVVISNSSFTLNNANGEGGAIYFGSNRGEINYCTFTKNTAKSNGGALVIADTAQDISNCLFESNNATAKGGSVYVKSVSNANIHDSTFKNSRAFDGGAIYNLGSTGASLRIVNDTFIKNIASHNGGAVYYMIDNDGVHVPVIYRDYNNFDNRGNIDPVSKRTTVDMFASGSTYTQRIFNSYFEDNEDYLLNISAIASNETTLAVVYIYNPKDADKASVNIIINITSGDEFIRSIIINQSNYDYYFNNNLQSFVINCYNLTSDKSYNVTVGFSDKVYLYKNANYTFHLGNVVEKGDFEILQGLIDEAIRTGKTELNLTRNYVFTIGLDKKCMNITSTLTINGNGYSLDALGRCRIFDIFAPNVVLNNIRFINGNANGVNGTGEDKGGAIYWIGANGVVINSGFRNNNASIGGGIYFNSSASNCKVSGCYFVGNNATYNGGAIDWNATNGNLTNTLFVENNADYGAALCREASATGGFGITNEFIGNNARIAGAALAWMKSANISIDNYTFINNTAVSGGAIYVGPGSGNCTIKNSVFIGNNATANGGAIDWYAHEGLVYNSNFTNNNALNGGAIYVDSTSGHINITKSGFISNNAAENGGAINLVASSVVVDNSRFTLNTASNGGALYVGGEGKTNYVYSSVFNSNIAKGGRGGAINWVASSGRIFDSNFTSNIADHGGAVYMGGNSSNSSISHVIFENNTALHNGGAISWNSTGGNLTHTQFISNYAGEFGAALCRETNSKGGFGYNNTFIANNAGISGAALAWLGSEHIEIINYTFINNTAGVSGGAIFVGMHSPNCLVINSTFIGNNVTSQTSGHGGAIDWEGENATIINSTFNNNKAFDGGAIFVGSISGKTDIFNSFFEFNEAFNDGGAINLETSSVSINKSSFYNNEALDGGAVYVSGKGITNHVYNSIFEGNMAHGGYGGAIDWLSSTGHIINSNFTSNFALNGGAIYLNGNSSNSVISGSFFLYNAADYDGGAIAWNASAGNLTNNYFLSNYAGQYGGALCRESNATGGFGFNNTFEDNYASVAGAALAWIGVGKITIDTYYFYNNVAGNGGAIYIDENSDNCKVLNSIFKNNNATNDLSCGGAIDCLGDNFTVINTNFTNNNAVYGGALYGGSSSGSTNVANATFTGNNAGRNGGAVMLIASAANIYNSDFFNNTAFNGGALYVGGDSKINYVYLTNFEGNKAIGGYGGAIDWVASSGHIFDSNFTLNSADYGGAVYMGGNSSNSAISHVVFNNNSATYNGGAINWNATGGNLTHTLFKYNSAGKYGGALCRETNATGGFGINCTFENNHAGISGAALAWLGAGKIKINKYNFINNTADYSGGAIYVAGDSEGCKVLNSNFENNYVSNAIHGHGGAIDWVGLNGHVENSTFTGCISPKGGAICVGDNSNNFKVINSAFTSCISLAEGGAILIYADNATIKNSNFTSSLALVNGAAIAGINSNDVVISDCIFKNGVVAGHTDVSGETKGNGGAIYWQDSNNLKVLNSEFTLNEARSNGASFAANNCNNSILYNVSFYNDTAVNNGGSIIWENSDNAVIDSARFNYIGSVFNGGAIYFNNINAKVLNSKFNDTKAGWGDAGAIYVNGNVTIDNSTFVSFLSFDNNGSAILFKAGNSILSNSNFSGINPITITRDAMVTLIKNNITESGDGIYSVLNEGILFLDNNAFDNIILNDGIIKTQTYTYVLDNSIWNATVGENFTLWAKIFDDTKKNIIVSKKSLYFTNNITSEKLNAPYIGLKNNTAVFMPKRQGIYLINITDSNLEKNTIYYGLLNAKVKTNITIEYNQSASGDEVTFKAVITQKDVYDITGNVTFMIGNKIIGIGKVINGSAIISTSSLFTGTYRVTAIYSGDEHYWDSENSTLCSIELRKTWIKIAINNIVYGQNATAVITTNSNGTIRFTLHGRDQIIELPVVNGTAKINLTVNDYKTTGMHSVGVDVLGNEYYQYETNQTSFEVYKLNTPIVAIPTTPIYVKDVEIINITVDKKATGYVKVTIRDKEYYKKIVNGNILFDIADLSKDNYRNVIVEYLGDEFFNANSTKVSFEVKSIDDYPIRVIVEDIHYGNNATIYVSLPGDVSENVIIVVNTTEYKNIPVVNGLAVLHVSGLDVGTYNVTAVYPGDLVYVSKSNMTSFKVIALKESQVNVTASDVTYGNNSLITIKVPTNQTGFVRIIIDGTNVDIVCLIENGTAKCNAPVLDVGRYLVNVTYLGNPDYFTSTNHTYFNVTKAVLRADVTIPGVSIVDEVYAVISLLDNFKGNVTVAVDDKIYNGTLKSIINLGKLSLGDKVANVTFYGDNNFNVRELKVNFKVFNGTSSYQAVTEVITNSTLVVTVPDNTTGNITIIFSNGTNMTVPLINGSGNFSLENVTPGKQNITIVYRDGIRNVTVNSTIDVPKHITPIKVNTTDIYVGDVAKIVVILSDKITGNVTIEIDGKNYTNTTVGGIATFYVANLSYGNKTFAAKYLGDSNYKDTYTIASFEVLKRPSNVIVNGINIFVGEDEVINVEVNKQATGYVLLEINNNVYVVKLVEGAGSVVVPGLAKGEYTINANYLGDDSYLPNTNSSIVIVSEREPNSFIKDNKNMKVFYKEGAKFTVRIVDDNGKALGGKLVTFKVKDLIYSTVSDSKGYASMMIDWKPGKYTITTSCEDSTVSNKIKVKSVIHATKNVKVKKSKKNTKFKIALWGLRGKVVKKPSFKYAGKPKVSIKIGKDLAGKKVSVKFKGEYFKTKVKANGKGVIKINKKLARELKLKNGKKYKARVVYKDMVIYKKKPVNVKIDGKTYTVKTNKKGAVIFKITKKMVKNLEIGKKYPYYIEFGENTAKRNLVIKK